MESQQDWRCAFLEELEAVPRQAGAVFTINGIVAGLDVFDSPATWRKSMRKAVRSYGLGELDNAGGLVVDGKVVHLVAFPASADAV
jgi:hypothetical protein